MKGILPFVRYCISAVYHQQSHDTIRCVSRYRGHDTRLHFNLSDEITFSAQRKQKQQRKRTAYAACIQRILSKMALCWSRGEELMNKVVVFVFFVQKRCSCCFIKFRLNHWWQMDHSDDAFHTFLGIDRVIYFAVNGTVTSLPVFIQNILNRVPKMDKAFRGLERHGGKWLMTQFSFWGGVAL